MSGLKIDAASSVIAQFDANAAAYIRSGELFTIGLVNGLIKKQNLNEMDGCLRGFDVASSKTGHIIDSLIKGGGGDISSIITAITTFVDIAVSLPVELKDCANMSSDADRIASWAIDGLSPSNMMFKIPTNVIDNYESIFARCVNIVIQLTTGSWEDAGSNYAAILVLGLGELPAAIDRNKEAALKLILQRNTERSAEQAAADKKKAAIAEAHRKALEKAGLKKTPKQLAIDEAHRKALEKAGLKKSAENLYLY